MALVETAPRRKRLGEGINQIAFSREGEAFAYSDVHMNLVLPSGLTRSLTSINQKVRSLERVRTLLFSDDDKTVFVSAGDHIWEFDAITGQEKWRFMPPRAWGFLIVSPMGMAISNSGLVAAATDDGEIFIWNSERELVAKFGSNQPQKHLAFAGATDELVGFESFAMSRYNLQTRKRTVRFALPDKSYAMTVSPGGHFAAVRTLSHVYILDAQSGQVMAERNVLAGLPVLACHPTLSLIAVGEDDSVSIVDLKGKLRQQIPIDNAEVVAVEFNPNGRFLAIGCSNHQILHQPVELAGF